MSSKIALAVRMKIIGCFNRSKYCCYGMEKYEELVRLTAAYCNELSDLTVEDKAEFLFKKKKLYVKFRSDYFPISIAKRQTGRMTIKNRLCQVPVEFWGEEWLE